MPKTDLVILTFLFGLIVGQISIVMLLGQHGSNKRIPKFPPADGCLSYGACGHCGARGGGECQLREILDSCVE